MHPSRWRGVPRGRRIRTCLVHAMLERLGLPRERLPSEVLYAMDAWRLTRLSNLLGRRVERRKAA